MVFFVDQVKQTATPTVPELTPTVPDTGNALTNGDNLQAAINASAIGDTIILKSGATYATRTSNGTGFTFPARGASWDNRRVTIECSRIGELPAGTRVSPAQSALLANVVTNAATPVINFANARGWTLQGLAFTNTATVSNNGGFIDNLVDFTSASADLTIDRCWVHPLESATDPSSKFRTAGRAFWNVACPNVALTNSYADGFTGWKSSDHVSEIDSKVLVLFGGAAGLSCKNNFLQGYFGTFMFVGGTTAIGTTTIVSSADHTHAVLTDASHLTVGDLVAFQTTAGYEAGQIQSIAGNSVVFGPRTTDVGFTPQYVAHDLVAGGGANWAGTNPDRLTFQGNTFDCLALWSTWTNPTTSAPLQSDHRHLIAYGMTNARIIGNQFTGTTFGSLGLFQFQGQTGPGNWQPWVMIGNILIMSNFLDGPAAQLCQMALNNANSAAAWSGHDIYLVNNLRRSNTATANDAWATEFSACGGPIGNGQALNVGRGLNALHNTLRAIDKTSWVAQGQPNVYCDMRNNVSNSGRFWLNTLAVGTDFPNLLIATNLWVNNSGSAPPSYITADFVVADDTAAHFTNAAAADAGGSITGYTLTSSSPGYQAASDGTDAGCNITDLQTAIGGSGLDWAWPELPRTLLDTTYRLPTGGTTRNVAAGSASDFQAKLNVAVPGDIIVLQAGTTYTGNFTLTNTTNNGQWIYITSSASASLPAPGTRVGPSDAGNMPLIQSNNSDPAIKMATSCTHYRFVGCQLTTTSSATTNLILLDLTGGNTSASAMPSDFTFDRCYMHGGGTDVKRAIRGLANNVAVVDSYLENFRSSDRADTQTVNIVAGAGIKLVNNFLEASAENIMFGGDSSTIAQFTPADIEIRNNFFTKRQSWNPNSGSYGGVLYAIKNLFELKNAQRVWVDGNTFDGFWGQDQDMAITFTPRNQNGDNPWSRITDVTFTHNILQNFHPGYLGQTTGGIVIAGKDDAHSSQATDRVLIQYNAIGGTGGIPDHVFHVYSSDLITGPNHLVIDHNTCIGGTVLINMDQGTTANFVFTNNIMPYGTYGIVGNGQNTILGTLGAYAPGAFVRNNLIIGLPGGNPMPAVNFSVADAASVGFVNLAGGNLLLTSSSVGYRAGYEGVSLGADIT